MFSPAAILGMASLHMGAQLGLPPRRARLAQLEAENEHGRQRSPDREQPRQLFAAVGYPTPSEKRER
jgi:hypothetical protein